MCKSTLSLLAMMILSLAGCGSPTYHPPQLGPDASAIILGFDGGPNGTRTRLVYIDKQLLPPSLREKVVPIPLAPGVHEFRYYVAYGERSKVGMITFTAESGVTYVVRSSDPVGINEYCARSSIWIEKQVNGDLIVDKTPIILVRLNPATEMMAGNVFISVPGKAPSCGQ